MNMKCLSKWKFTFKEYIRQEGVIRFNVVTSPLDILLYLTCIFICMMMSSNGNMFRVTGFCEGIHRWLLGIHRSPMSSPHTDQWRGALMFSFICAWTNSWVNNQDAGDLRLHHSHYDITLMWCRIVIQWSGQPWDLSAFNTSLLSNFELVKRAKLGGSVHYWRNGFKFGTLLYLDYHSLKWAIFCTQRQVKFVVSDHPWICRCIHRFFCYKHSQMIWFIIPLKTVMICISGDVRVRLYVTALPCLAEINQGLYAR